LLKVCIFETARRQQGSSATAALARPWSPRIDFSTPTLMNRNTSWKVPAFLRTIAGQLFGFCALLAGCAGQVAPSGGPVDTTPPLIFRSTPDSNATRATPSYVELEFSEYVERRTVEEAVFVSPYLGKLEFDWSGTEVTIRWPEQLRDNTTYVLTIGTDVADIRAGNRMAHAYTLAFSTGDSIDRGMISGRVFDEHPEGVMIFAYNLNEMLPDTLNPTHTRPQYIMQTGRDGTFRLQNIALGKYRVIAVRDEYRNLMYDREIDQYGVASEDPELSEARPAFSNLWFRLSKEDTTRPFLAGVSAVDARHLLVRFSEPVDTLSFPRAVFSLADTVAGVPVTVVAQYQDMSNQALAHVEIADPLDSVKSYRLHVKGIVDRVGNPMDTSNASSLLSGPAPPDTLKPVPTVRGIADSARGVALDRPFEVSFSRPVDLSRAMRGIVLKDSLYQIVPLNIQPRTPAEVLVIPAKTLQSNARYRLTVSLDSLRDSGGAYYHDSVLVLRFFTLDSRTLGSIEGELSDSTGSHAVIVSSKSTNLTPARIVESRLQRPGKFVIHQLPEGFYSIEAFEDVNGDGQYNAGLPYPYKNSARFAVYPDTVKVRARWSVEGVLVRLR